MIIISIFALLVLIYIAHKLFKIGQDISWLHNNVNDIRDMIKPKEWHGDN